MKLRQNQLNEDNKCRQNQLYDDKINSDKTN